MAKFPNDAPYDPNRKIQVCSDKEVWDLWQMTAQQIKDLAVLVQNDSVLTEADIREWLATAYKVEASMDRLIATTIERIYENNPLHEDMGLDGKEDPIA